MSTAVITPRPGERARTVRRRLAGVAFLVVLALLVWLSIAVYNKDFTDTATVTVKTDSVGNEMHPYADVKMRGVVVGEVRGIEADPDGEGAKLNLALKPGKLGRIPADVQARMLPTTLFGERFVALVPPEDTTALAAATAVGTLRPGTTIPQDRSKNAIELEQVLSDTLPLLQAVKPAKLSATLTAVSQALSGRGEKLGDTLVELDRHLSRLNPHLPTLNRDFHELVQFSHTYSDAAPDVVDALDDATVTSATIADQRQNLGTLYGSVSNTSVDLRTFLRQNQGNIIRLSAHSRPTLRLLAKYAPEFPCTLRTLADFVPAMDKALGKGTRHPGLHATVKVVKSQGKYVPGRDTPVYDATGGPHCYSVPYTGRTVPTSTSHSTRKATAGTLSVPGTGGLGLPNSPQENQLVNELLSAGMTKKSGDLPDWSALLAGPAFRGAEVTLK
jgi:phospholipid/cholesterol/gamma-HCH transport system substrate-binding protein